MSTAPYGLIFVCVINALLVGNVVETGPAVKREPREIYPELDLESDAKQSQVCIVGDVVYAVDDRVPADQPCLRCKCQPPGVQCEATRCVYKRHGCKVIHRPNQCCPDYQCECEYNGTKYSNGERIKTSPGNECKVCYCRGGEIQCTNVSCYVRDDCEGKQVPGQCCLKYDHCPTRDSLLEKQGNDSLGSGVRISASSTPPIEENVLPVSSSFNISDSGITIQEITPEVKEISEEKSNELYVTDSDAESSEISEVIHQAPPIIKIGDASVITLLGAEGLQRGEIEDLETTTEKTQVSDYSEHTTNDLSTAASSNILSLVKKKKKSSPVQVAENSFSSSLPPNEITETTHTPSAIDDCATEIAEDLVTLNFPDTTSTKPETTPKENLEKSTKQTETNIPLINFRAALPFDILNAPAESDTEPPGIEENSKEDQSDITTPAPGTEKSERYILEPLKDSHFPESDEIDSRSVETLEVSKEYSGEKTTPKSKKAEQFVPEENASVAGDKNISEINDMIRKNEEIEKSAEWFVNTTDAEIEIINISNLETTTQNAKNLSKRENNEDDAIFSQLDDELGLGTTQKPKTLEEEDAEAREIFRELLEETSTPKSKNVDGSKSKENEALERVGQALTKVALRGAQPLDIGVLGVLRDFFSSQYKAYDTKSP